MNTVSSLYQELTGKELCAVCGKTFGTEKHTAQLLSGGLFNTTYLITLTETGRKYVLRTGPVNRHLLLPFEENLMKGEAKVYDLLKEHNIPCSTVVSCDTSKTVLDRDYMVVEYIESFPLCQLDEQNDQLEKLQEETGRYTKQIHHISGAGFGRISNAVTGKIFPSWDSYFEDELTSWKKRVQTYQLYAPDELNWIEKAYEKTLPYLQKITQPKLVHADLWSGNVLVKKDDQNLSVAAIIDADRAIWGDPDYDLASGWIISPAFLRGYGPIPNEPSREVRKNFYLMMYRLIDSYVWQIQYHTPENYHSAKAEGLTLAKKLVSEL